MIKLKKTAKEYDPNEDLLNEELIAQAVWQCLKDKDPDEVIEILEAHLRTKISSVIVWNKQQTCITQLSSAEE